MYQLYTYLTRTTEKAQTVNTEFNKEYYKYLVARAKANNVSIAQRNTTNDDYTDYNGITIAFSPATELEDNHMLEVSISYCAKEDQYNKRIGQYHALNKFLEENMYVQLPLGDLYRRAGAEETGHILLLMFTL